MLVTNQTWCTQVTGFWIQNCARVCLFGVLKAPGKHSQMCLSTVWQTQTQHRQAHTPTLYPANLQSSGSPDCVCSTSPIGASPKHYWAYSLSVFFIVLSRYFPWWLACCRWERAKFFVWIMNLAPSSHSSARHSTIHSDAISSIPIVCVHVFNKHATSSLKKADLQDRRVPRLIIH